MEQALIAKLLGEATIAAIVGTRIFYNTRAQGEDLPAVVMHVIDKVPVDSAEGADVLTISRVQVDCIGTTYGSAKGLARAVKRALATPPEFTQDGVEFSAVYVEAERDDFEKSTTKDSISVHRVAVDFMLSHANNE